MQPIITCVIAGLQYLIHPQKIVFHLVSSNSYVYLAQVSNKQKGSIQETINPDAILPVTLLATDEIFGDLDAILELLDDYDDIFTPDFGSVLVEKPGQSQSNTSELTSLKGSSTRQIHHLESIAGFSRDLAELPSGPYFLHGPNLHQAWRLYSDNLEAFALGVIPDDLNQPDKFQVFTSLASQGDFKSIAVPSRLYHPRPSPRNPLSGLRFSVGDFTSLKGIPASLSSRAWASLYPSASNSTSKVIEKLISLGAVIVGKAKTSQLGTGAEWIDTQAPCSPRGDGYQTISGNSVGAAAAVSGYDWLQGSISSDDNGVSAQHGIYSIALSPGSVSHDAILTISGYDNVRLFSRSLQDLLRLTTTILCLDSLETTFPKRVIYPVDFHQSANEAGNSSLDCFLTALETFLGFQVERVNLGKIWDESRPREAHGEAMQEYMKNAPFRSWSYEYCHAFDNFRSQYHDKFQKKPFIEATPQFLWDTGKAVSKGEYENYLNRLRIYREWFDAHIMQLDSTPNTEAVMILPCGMPQSRYRDEPTAPPTTSKGITPENVASILGAPHLAVPFTQVPYESRISGETEYKPVCVSIMGNRGSETVMLHLIKQAFEKAHWRTQVGTGRLAFPLKEDHGNLPIIQLQDSSDEL